MRQLAAKDFCEAYKAVISNKHKRLKCRRRQQILITVRLRTVLVIFEDTLEEPGLECAVFPAAVFPEAVRGRIANCNRNLFL